MSRTVKDKPWRVLERQFPAKRERGFPPPFGGAWAGRKHVCRAYHSSVRMRVREHILNERPEPVYRRTMGWELY